MDDYCNHCGAERVKLMQQEDGYMMCAMCLYRERWKA